jgi:glutamate-ammonia-ligase adenylyltransferase
MALTRARAISGAPPLRTAIAEVIAGTLTAPRDAAATAREVRDMRETLAREKGDARRWDLKYVRGGLVDLEFVAQYLQLVHGHAHPAILHPTTARVFDAARAAGVLGEGDWEALSAGARLQHDLTQVLRLCLDGPFDPAAAGPGVRALLARAAHAPDFARLEALLAETQDAVRAVFERVVGG